MKIITIPAFYSGQSYIPEALINLENVNVITMQPTIAEAAYIGFSVGAGWVDYAAEAGQHLNAADLVSAAESTGFIQAGAAPAIKYINMRCVTAITNVQTGSASFTFRDGTTQDAVLSPDAWAEIRRWAHTVNFS